MEAAFNRIVPETWNKYVAPNYIHSHKLKPAIPQFDEAHFITSNLTQRDFPPHHGRRRYDTIKTIMAKAWMWYNSDLLCR